MKFFQGIGCFWIFSLLSLLKVARICCPFCGCLFYECYIDIDIETIKDVLDTVRKMYICGLIA